MGNLFSKKKDESSKETKDDSASCAEESSDVDKVELFVNDRQPPAQPAVQIRPSQQAVCKLIVLFRFYLLKKSKIQFYVRQTAKTRVSR